MVTDENREVGVTVTILMGLLSFQKSPSGQVVNAFHSNGVKTLFLEYTSGMASPL